MHCVSDWMRPVNCYKGLYFCNAVFPAPWDFQMQYLVWPLQKLAAPPYWKSSIQFQ